ncbi:MAG: hypothetical protein N3C60_00065 [Calditerrivibrio sp.]|nr:hypothetical protein [Calditerrivibrio sp.]
MNITLSAGLTGMIFSLISNSYKKVYDLQFSAFCGVFAGMTSHIFLHSSKIIQILPFFVGVLFFISRNIFLGIGGKLGALAYVAIIIFMVLNGIFI